MRTVIRFLWAKNVSPSDIHRQIMKEYRDEEVSRQSVPTYQWKLKSLTFSGDNKRFLISPKFQLEQASPQLILDCLGLDWEDIRCSPLLVSDFIKVNGFTVFFRLRLTRREISNNNNSYKVI
ncbi:hypothetical protein TNCV_3974201 [Trichonephila clavipes]|nr:hypothetical protein TNCV_3974201 [Trichonephila clavipes]